MQHGPLAFLWPLVYVAAAICLGVTLERLWSMAVGVRIARRWNALTMSSQALGPAIFIWIFLIGVYAATLEWVTKPQTDDFIRKLLLAIALAAATWVAGRTAFGLVSFYSRSAVGLLPSSSLLATIGELCVMIVGALIVLGSMGISIAPILTALGVGGLAVGLALSAPLGNLFAGLQIIASRDMRPGDYIRFDGGPEGWVVDIAWNYTTVRDRSDSLVVMPNTKVTTTPFTNYNLPDSHMTIEIKATIDPNADLDTAEKYIHDAAVEALRACKVDSDFDPRVRFLELTDTRIEFVAFLRANTFVDQFKIRHEFVKRMHRKFRSDPKALPILTGVA